MHTKDDIKENQESIFNSLFDEYKPKIYINSYEHNFKGGDIDYIFI